MEHKKIKIVSIFIRLGLDRPHAMDHRNKLERIKHKSALLTEVFGTQGMIFVNKN